MSDKFLDKIKKDIKKEIFSDEDLKVLFFDKPLNQIQSLLSYHLKQRHLIKYKRGVYSLNNSLSISKFELGNKLYYPSYVSFESALSYHGLIPEAVYETSSACYLLKKKIFENELGIFSYRYSPIKPFFLEVESTNSFVAKPIRALFDLIYSNRKKYNNISDIELDFRLDLDSFFKLIECYSNEEILSLGELYKKNSTRALARMIIGSR